MSPFDYLDASNEETVHNVIVVIFAARMGFLTFPLIPDSSPVLLRSHHPLQGVEMEFILNGTGKSCSTPGTWEM